VCLQRFGANIRRIVAYETVILHIVVFVHVTFVYDVNLHIVVFVHVTFVYGVNLHIVVFVHVTFVYDVNLHCCLCSRDICVRRMQISQCHPMDWNLGTG
jgi:hypothetical protein